MGSLSSGHLQSNESSRLSNIFAGDLEPASIDDLPHLPEAVDRKLRSLQLRTMPKENRIWRVNHGKSTMYVVQQTISESTGPEGSCTLYRANEDNVLTILYFVNLVDRKAVRDIRAVFSNGADLLIKERANTQDDLEAIYNHEMQSLRYQGAWAAAGPNGFGTQVSTKGIYKGNFVQAEKQGTGEYAWTDATMYRGQVKDGLPHFKGELIHRVKKYNYVGDFFMGDRHGQGEEKTEKDHYEGEFKFGQRKGKGTVKILDPSSGQFLAQYKGEFLNDLPHGKGTYRNFQSSGAKESSWKAVSGVWRKGVLEVILKSES